MVGPNGKIFLFLTKTMAWLRALAVLKSKNSAILESSFNSGSLGFLILQVKNASIKNINPVKAINIKAKPREILSLIGVVPKKLFKAEIMPKNKAIRKNRILKTLTKAKAMLF